MAGTPSNGRGTITELEEVLQFVRETLPQPKTMQELQIKNPPGVVSFQWNRREYLVKPSLQVYEVRGKDIFMTAPSMLMQAALQTKSRTQKVLGASVDSLVQVEDFIKTRNVEKGFTLLGSIKKALVGLGNK